MRVLSVMDPLERLHPEVDTTLALLRELSHRGHETWMADSPDIWYENKSVFANAKRVIPKPKNKYETTNPTRHPLAQFDLILIRKEPPFDSNYLYLTYLLELMADRIPVVNHPRGIRDANEKLSILHFPFRIPETIVTNSPARILQFQKNIKEDLVLKPLDQKGGEGVALAQWKGSRTAAIIRQATGNGKKFVIAQRFLKKTGTHGEKRILILNGEILTAFEKRPAKGDFRANLGLGATAHATNISPQEEQLVREMKPYLLKEGLLFVGLDVIANQLIEVNVTCPSGITDAKSLYPRLAPAEAWADSLEELVTSY